MDNKIKKYESKQTFHLSPRLNQIYQILEKILRKILYYLFLFLNKFGFSALRFQNFQQTASEVIFFREYAVF